MSRSEEKEEEKGKVEKIDIYCLDDIIIAEINLI